MARQKFHTKVTEVSVGKFRSGLSHWLDVARRGGEVIVTVRGRPVARVLGAGRPSRLEELIEAGIVKPAKRPKRPARPGIKVRGSVSDLVIE